MRARGWRSSFPIGEPAPGPGVPLISAFRWDTGVQVRMAGGTARGDAARSRRARCRTRGSSDDNGGKQIVRPRQRDAGGRPGHRRRPARGGAWLARGAMPVGQPRHSSAPSAPTSSTREITGSSRGEMVCRAAGALPCRSPPSTRNRSTLGALDRRTLPDHAADLPRRARRSPRLLRRFSAARRGSRMPLPWDAPVTRVEAGGGYYLQRNLVVRATRPGELAHGRPACSSAPTSSAQIAYWF